MWLLPFVTYMNWISMIYRRLLKKNISHVSEIKARESRAQLLPLSFTGWSITSTHLVRTFCRQVLRMERQRRFISDTQLQTLSEWLQVLLLQRPQLLFIGFLNFLTVRKKWKINGIGISLRCGKQQVFSIFTSI